jgi:hypothetical protein
MPTEDLAAYQLHLNRYTAEYHPQGATEADLVQIVADTSWRLNRVAALETNLLSLALVGDLSPLPGAPQQVQDALSIVAALDSQSKALSILSVHSQRLSRQLERTIAQLHNLQKIRRLQEKHELNDLLDIIQMHESEGKTYDHSADGFVFSTTQIEAARRTRNRERLASEAYEYHCETAA